MATPQSAPPSSPGSTIDDPDISEEDSKQWAPSERLTRDTRNASSPADNVHPQSPKVPRNSSMDRKETQSPKRSLNKSRKSKAAPARGNFSWVHEGPQEGNTEDEGSVANEDNVKKSRWPQKHADSRRNSDVDVKRATKAATTIGTRRQANGTIGTVYSGNKIGHIKKDDGVPLWRRDIQYAFLQSVFEDKTAVFTRVSDGQQDCNFADIYIDAMARSSKTSKVLKEKLQSDRAAAQNMAMICLLVNVGRMNTTLNFFPEMRAQLRTYHSIPALQAHQDSNAYKQLQDAPRLKSILKGASEDNMDEPRTIEAIQARPIPRTNPVNLIFVLSQHAPKTSELHFSSPVDFFDLVTRHIISSKSRSRAFLWLMWWYLQSNFTKEDALNNPFGPGAYKGDNTEGIPMQVPEFEHLTEKQGDAENIDPLDELAFGEEKQRERKRILEEEDAENKPLKRVKRTAAGDEILSDVESTVGHPVQAQAGHGAFRDPSSLALLNSTYRHDPSTSQLGGQADSLEDDWEPVNPHPGRGRYKRVKTKDRENSGQSAGTPALTSSSGRILLKTQKAQPYPADPGTPDGGACATPQPPGAAHPILHQYGPTTEALTRGDAPLGANAGNTGSVHRRPRPLTQHQLQVEANRRARVETILATKKREVFAALRDKRERSNFVLRAAKRIQNLPVGYDSEDEATSWGIGGLGPNPNGGEEDDYGEEAESWLRVLRNTRKRLAKWVGDVEVGHVITRHDGDAQATLEVDGRTRFTRIRDGTNGDADVEMEDRGTDEDAGKPMALAPDGRGLDDIDKSLLAERSDEDDIGDDESDGGSGEESDVEMD
jgi:Ino eighty subunit 1